MVALLLPALLSYSPESVDYFGTALLEFVTMNRGQTREERSATLGYLHVHVASVSAGSLPDGQFSRFQFVEKTDGSVMLHLQPLANLANGHAIRTRGSLNREKSFILFRRQFCLSGKHVRTKAKKLPHRISEGTEGDIVFCLECLLHPETRGVVS
jgi:hypothetical protein